MADNLLTLTEVSKRTGISMPTLQRYKKLYQARIPSEGSGRTQRYPESALAVFRELKKENIGRRGRPRKHPLPPAKGAKGGAKVKKSRRKSAKKSESAAESKEGLLTLTEIGKVTGISYPTLLRYVKAHLPDIPHVGAGRARRYLSEAVDVFKDLRSKSRRGRTKGSSKKSKAAKKTVTKAASGGDNAALMAKIGALEKSIKSLQKDLARVEKAAKKPYRITLQR